jgi:hypothetical protein
MQITTEVLRPGIDYIVHGNSLHVQMNGITQGFDGVPTLRGVALGLHLKSVPFVVKQNGQRDAIFVHAQFVPGFKNKIELVRTPRPQKGWTTFALDHESCPKFFRELTQGYQRRRQAYWDSIRDAFAQLHHQE